MLNCLNIFWDKCKKTVFSFPFSVKGGFLVSGLGPEGRRFLLGKRRQERAEGGNGVPFRPVGIWGDGLRA